MAKIPIKTDSGPMGEWVKLLSFNSAGPDRALLDPVQQTAWPDFLACEFEHAHCTGSVPSQLYSY